MVLLEYSSLKMDLDPALVDELQELSLERPVSTYKVVINNIFIIFNSLLYSAMILATLSLP